MSEVWNLLSISRWKNPKKIFFCSIYWAKTSVYLFAMLNMLGIYFSNCLCILFKFRLVIAINRQAIQFHEYTKKEWRIIMSETLSAGCHHWNSSIHIHKALIFGYQLTPILDIKLLDSHCGILPFFAIRSFFFFFVRFATCFKFQSFDLPFERKKRISYTAAVYVSWIDVSRNCDSYQIFLFWNSVLSTFFSSFFSLSFDFKSFLKIHSNEILAQLSNIVDE